MSEDAKKHGQEIESRIREVAYLMRESAGRLSDMAQEYWVAAEKEVLATWWRATEQILPGEKTEEPKAETSKPAPPEAPGSPKAAAKPSAKAQKTKGQKAETAKPKSAKASGTKPKAEAKAEKP